jgi:hypothetical protein
MPVTPEWMATMVEALTDEVCRVALRYAWGRVELMKRADVVVQDDEAFALTNDAIADTMTRVRVWDPARVKLGTHLCGVMRSRTNARIARVRKLRHESIDELDDSWDAPAEVEASLAKEAERTRAEAAMAQVRAAGQVLDGLRHAANADADVLAILSAYGDGVTERQEVMERLGWELPRFVNARRRLDRLIRELPANVREAAVDSMRVP